MESPDRRRLHHRTGGWLRQHKKIFIIGGVALLLSVVVLQLLYPRDRALPFAQIDSGVVGYQKSSDILARLQTTFLTSKVTFQISPEDKVTRTLRELGASPNTEQMTRSLTHYSWQQRLLPFSIVFLRPHLDGIDVYFSHPQLLKSAASIAKELSRPPRDARLAIKDGELVTTSAVNGHVVTTEEITHLLSTSNLAFATTVLSPKSEPQLASYTDADLAPVRSRGEAMISRHIVLTEPSGRKFIPNAATIASWIILKTRADHSITLSVDKGAIAKYVATINTDLGIPAGTTTAQLLDGQETSRSLGKVGRAVVAPPLIDGLMQAVNDEGASQQLDVQLVPVAPRVVYSRQYSSSQAGLRAYVQYVTSTEDIHISLAQLDGNGWTASGRASESIPSASTYKLYVAMVLFDKIDKGEIKWSDSMLDTNVATCVEQMIVPSLNACAEKFIAEFGRGYINSFLYARGISSATTFTAEGAIRTSAADLVTTLRGLAKGTLYKGTNRDILLEKMGRQIYRGGIPTGSSGSVQDKVGFLWDYTHDAAIVHTSKGSYVAAIMTNGASYARIAQITMQLERIMYP